MSFGGGVVLTDHKQGCVHITVPVTFLIHVVSSSSNTTAQSSSKLFHLTWVFGSVTHLCNDFVTVVLEFSKASARQLKHLTSDIITDNKVF